MSVEEIGEIQNPFSYAIKWIIPSFTLFYQKKDTRIWSPSFLHHYKYGKNSHFPSNYIQMTCHSRDGIATPIKNVRFGIADMKNSEICCCRGEWSENRYRVGYFVVPEFVSLEIWNQFSSSLSEKPRFRLFCEVDQDQCSQELNAFSQSDNCAMPSPITRVSTGKEDENWSYGSCSFSNSSSNVFCPMNDIPFSVKDNYPEEVGEIRHPSSYVIKWIIPSFSLLFEKKDARLWSPSFLHHSKYGKYGHFPSNYIQMVCHSRDGRESHIKNVRFGIADMKNSEICCCHGEWSETRFRVGYFIVPELVSLEVWNQFSSSHSEKPRFRLFCEVVKDQCFQELNAFSQSGNCATGRKGENWSCGNCTFSNSSNNVSCQMCGIPSLVKQNYPDKSETDASVPGNIGPPVRNLPICIICYENERDIVFQPCCHLITCRDCANLLKDCPTCRRPVTNKLKVFIN